jgi:hypothetical protein
MHEFSGTGEVQEALDALTRRDDPLVTRLERLAGHKEARYAQLLTGEPDVEAFAAARAASPSKSAVDNDRIVKLEDEVVSLKEQITLLSSRFDEFSKQFE